MAPTEHSWHYQVSAVQFLPFPDESSDFLENAYEEWLGRGSPHELARMQSGKYTYEVDFTRMVQTNVMTSRTRALQRQECRGSLELRNLGEKLARVQATLQQVQQQHAREAGDCASLRGQLAQLASGLREKDARLAQLRGQCQDALHVQAEVEAASRILKQEKDTLVSDVSTLTTQLSASQQRARELEARSQQLSDRAAQDGGAARQLSEELRVAREETERLRAASQGLNEELGNRDARVKELEEALQQKDTDLQRVQSGEGMQWQFINHFGKWLAYSADMGADMDRFFKQWQEEGQPNKAYQLSDRYQVNFAESWQENLKHGTRRDIRQQAVAGLPARLDTEEVLANAKQELEAKEEELAEARGLLEATRESHEKTEVKIVELRQKAADREANIEELRRQAADREAEIAELRQQAADQEADIAELRFLAGDQEAEIAELRQQAADQEDMIGELRQTTEDLSAKVEARDEELGLLQRKVHQLKAELRVKDKELCAARREAEQLPEVRRDLEQFQKRCQTLSEGKEMQERDRTIAELRESLREAKAELEKESKALSQARVDSMFGKANPLQAQVDSLQSQLDAKQREFEKAVEKECADVAAENKRLADQAARLTKDLKEAKDNAKVQQRGLQNELKERDNAVKKMLDQHAALAANVLTGECRSMAALAAMKEVIPDADDETSRSAGASNLIAPEVVRVLEGIADMRKSMLNLSTPLLDILGELREPDAQEVVDMSGVTLEPASADFKFIEHLVQRSVTQHRLTYHSDEWCEPPKLRIVQIELLPLQTKQVRLYRSERDRIGKRNIPEMPFPMGGALKPFVAKDTNEFFLFHGCPWDSVPSICTQGFDWKFRGTHQGCMFGQGIYFAPNASKCDGYSDKNADGQKCMLLARVLLGASVPRWRRCTNVKTLGKNYDSIFAATRDFGGSVDHPEVCIFQKLQALPAAKITYAHEDDCACHQCRNGA